MRITTGVLARLMTGVCVILGTPLLGEFAAAQDPGAPSAGIAVAEFTIRTQAYAVLHRRLEGPLSTVKVSDDPAEVRQAMDALAHALKRARAHAREGDVFTPDIISELRRLIRKQCAGGCAELLAIVNEEVDEPIPRPRVNGRWPHGAPFSMVPPDLLCSLPALPEELEYRFIKRDLVLWDVHADLIVDVIRNLIPPETAE